MAALPCTWCPARRRCNSLGLDNANQEMLCVGCIDAATLHMFRPHRGGLGCPCHISHSCPCSWRCWGGAEATCADADDAAVWSMLKMRWASCDHSFCEAEHMVCRWGMEVSGARTTSGQRGGGTPLVALCSCSGHHHTILCHCRCGSLCNSPACHNGHSFVPRADH